MSLAFTDVLIEISDPAKLVLFQADPQAFVSRYSLSDGEKQALCSGESSRVRMYARSTAPGEKADFFAQFKGSNPSVELIEIDPTVEIWNENNNNFEANAPDTVFVDSVGKRYRAVPV